MKTTFHAGSIKTTWHSVGLDLWAAYLSHWAGETLRWVSLLGWDYSAWGGTNDYADSISRWCRPVHIQAPRMGYSVFAVRVVHFDSVGG